MATTTGLSKSLNLSMLISIGIGATIGTPIFTIVGSAAGMAGPAVVLSFLIGGGLTLLIGLTYSELSSAFPESGGGYTFAKKAYGGLPAFLTGWLMAFSFVVFGGLSALGFAYVVGYAVNLSSPGIVALALVSLVVFTYLNIVGVKQSGFVQMLLIAVLLFGIVLFLLVSGLFVSPTNFAPFMPTGWAGVLQGTAFVYVAYFGFETIDTVSGESAEPRKHLMPATMISIIVCMAIYALVSLVAVGVVGREELANSSTPLMLVASISLGGYGTTLMVILGAIATLTSLNASIVAASRTIYALSNDGLLPGILATLSTSKTPHVATLVSSILMGLFVSLGLLDYIANVADFNLFLGLSMISLSLILLRRKRSLLYRPFIASTWAAAASIVGLLTLILFLDRSAIATGTAIVILGVLIYVNRITPPANRTYLMGGVSMGAAVVLLAGIAVNKWSLVLVAGELQIQMAPVMAIGCVSGILAAGLLVTPLSMIFKKRTLVGTTTANETKYAFILEKVVAIIVLLSAAVGLLLFYADYHYLVLLDTSPQNVEGMRFLLGLCLLSFSFAGSVSGLTLIRRKYVHSEWGAGWT